ncbi:AsmA family protein [Craurococcus roseus]|uniref:AsmA family protein n=1 Tax=Craurococcus roseus TaxID=77585 RepID=A0ABN1EGW6_9PROT
MKFVRIVAVILLVPVAGTVVVAAAFGDRLLAAAIERAGPALVGRDVRVGGVSIDWGFPTSVTATDLVVANADWGGGTPLLRAGQAEATVELLDLLRLQVSPVRLALRQPALHLARDERGRWNLPSAGGGGDGSASGGGSLFQVAAPREIEVEGGEVTVDYLASPGVEARIAALSARGTPSGVEFRGTASLEGGAPIDVSGGTGPLAALFGGGEGEAKPFPIRLEIGPETARLSADGHMARPFDLAGVDLRVQGQGDDLAPLLAALAVPVAATPPFRFTAHLTDIERGWRLRNLAARLGESRMEGEASVLLAGRPKPFLKFDLVAPSAVTSDFGWLASAGGSGSGSGALGSWMDAKLPTAWLRRAEAEGDLRVERLEGLATEPAGLRAGVEMKDGRLRLQPLRVELAGGAAEGSATVEAADADAPPRAGLRLEADGLRLGPLLAAFGAGEVASGTARTASADLSGRGTTLREVVAGLDGVARFRVADGTVRVPGLAQLSMGLVETFGAVLGVGGDAGATPVACAIGDLPVRDGVVHTERLVMVTQRVAITAEGTIRLGDGTLRLTLTPSPLDEALLRVVVPVVLSGDLASPEVETHPELRVGAARTGVPADVCAEEAGGR